MRWVQLGAGPPILFLHGYGGSARWWTRNLGALAADHTVYALDLPGFGGSRSPARFSLSAAADTIAAWMEANHISASDVVAHSMGGQAALLLAARHPERVRSLVLAAPAGVPLACGLPVIAWRAFRSRRGGDPRFTPIVVAGSVRAGPRVLWQAVREIQAVDVRPLLATITAPTLILWGERDLLLPARHGEELARALSGATLRVVEGAGHNLMFDRPDLFNDAVRAFVMSLNVGAHAADSGQG